MSRVSPFAIRPGGVWADRAGGQWIMVGGLTCTVLMEGAAVLPSRVSKRWASQVF